MNVGIAGLGLIGGSMAKAIHRYAAAHSVFGLEKSGEILETARLQGVVQAELTRENAGELDLLLLALYPDGAIQCLRELAPGLKPGALVVDLCGVKRAVFAPLLALARAHGLRYVGGHPMAGRELSGYAAATAELFGGASMILTPPEGTDRATLQLLEAFFKQLGFGRIQYSDPEEHDRIIAYTTQLAHVVSCAYVQSPTAESHMGFSAGSFRDMTRVAKLNEHMWTQLFLDNREALAEEIEGLSRRLNTYVRLLRAGDEAELKQLLKNAREKKEALEEGERG